MWEPRSLTTLWAFTACYRNSFTFTSESRRRTPGFDPGVCINHWTTIDYLNNWATAECRTQSKFFRVSFNDVFILFQLSVASKRRINVNYEVKFFSPKDIFPKEVEEILVICEFEKIDELI
jgi:hypothetical protein